MEFPIAKRPLAELGPVERVERRAQIRRRQLSRSLRKLDRAVRNRMPTAAVKRKAEEKPYEVVAVAFLAGLVLGALT